MMIEWSDKNYLKLIIKRAKVCVVMVQHKKSIASGRYLAS